MVRRVLLLALVLAACSDGAPEPTLISEPSAPVDTSVSRAETPRTADAMPDSVVRAERLVRAEQASRTTMPFERSAMVFDTMEPPPVRVEILPRPQPAPAPPVVPQPTPRPPDPAPRPPKPPESAGSCDVRESEGFCFSYTGDGWSRPAATEHCADAPDASYQPSVCPATDAIARCRFTRDGAPTLEITYTYYAPYEIMLAQLACPGDFERLDDDG